ncbi:winged helix DNA-binding domain-containing protein [Streptomyces sp. BE133]|uniref:winged helix DNA-binding domain-containing protein n=1 Tax=Streptomyces sp. BE133 TaxID=3002523 RepID=UPI002E78809C|nr:winged helix DNA-binding domain-containing protein [Streptomyces sp. BE133]MEE1807243.1 winged helix DNA-binding domain-containing protein [Streptomyces sp. BE133]
MTDASVLSTRTLNRTLLQRQFLAARTSRPVLDVVEHLVALQGQEPNWPYVGLWTRLADFRHDDLTALLRDGRVVRSAALRSTQHLTSSNDFRWLRPVVQPVLDRTARAQYFAAQTAGLNIAELTDVGRELMAGQTLPRRKLALSLAERFPGRDGRVLAGAVELRVPMVHAPATGAWGAWGNRPAIAITLAEHWIGRPMAAPRVETMIRRYLAAFGPAGVMDIQAWSGLTRLRETLDGLRSQLHVFHDERGTELFDLPGAPLADPDLPVPVRFLPAFDNLLLGHTDRARVISDADRKLVMPGQAMVRPTFLVDGFVHGTWSVKGSALLIAPFRPLSQAGTQAVLDEAERLLAFVAPDAAKRRVTFT